MLGVWVERPARPNSAERSSKHKRPRWQTPGWPGTSPVVEGIGDRLKSRAAEPGRSGAETARRAGLMATHYGHYLQDFREPDLATLVRICRVLGIKPDVLLAYDQAAPGPDALLAKRAAVAAYVDVLDAGSLDLALPVVRAITATIGLRGPAPAPAEGFGAGKPAKWPRDGAPALPKVAPPPGR